MDLTDTFVASWSRVSWLAVGLRHSCPGLWAVGARGDYGISVNGLSGRASRYCTVQLVMCQWISSQLVLAIARLLLRARLLPLAVGTAAGLLRGGTNLGAKPSSQHVHPICVPVELS